MFSKITLDNYASFNHFELNLVENKTDKKAKKMAIIYGENGIGKTSLIRAVELLKRTYVALAASEELSKVIGQYNEKDFVMSVFNSTMSGFRVESIINRAHKVGSSEETKLTYESIILRKKYIYSMSFSSNSITEEKLLCDGVTIFKAKKHRLTLSENDFLDIQLKERLNASFKMYFGERYTFLSCIFSARRSIAKSFFEGALSPNLRAFLDMLDKIVVFTKDQFNSEIVSLGLSNSSNIFLPNFFSGRYTDNLKTRKEKTETALTMFFSSLYSNIVGAHYVIETNPQGLQQYSLYFIEKTGNDTVDVPYQYESTGTKKLVTLFDYLYKAATDNCVIFIDEIDEGINDILLRDIFNSIDDSIVGQFIVTTHNTLLLKASLKRNIYLLDRGQDNNVVSYSLDEFGRKIQPATDVIGQYLNGLYGGVPQSGSFSIDYIVEALRDYE